MCNVLVAFGTERPAHACSLKKFDTVNCDRNCLHVQTLLSCSKFIFS